MLKEYKKVQRQKSKGILHRNLPLSAFAQCHPRHLCMQIDLENHRKENAQSQKLYKNEIIQCMGVLS